MAGQMTVWNHTMKRLLKTLEDGVAREVRLDERRVLLDVPPNLILVLGQLEEVGRLLELREGLPGLHVRVVVRSCFHVPDKRLLARIVPAGVGAEVDVPHLLRLCKQRLGDFVMLGGGGPDVRIVRDPQLLVQILE
eukprot:CAMPEP_0180405700 /NCGR_PEP_ID=MMETSP0989-20121125/40757_1 /TAXON_ID=697907 /ORGANISM="non described non described, Strain CCMP2293" /LENGTH=135 /DNA_ID=CAMNT_0022409337 /DNA_START=62 /DNA_END=466 /DNA_ORIENTATION=+